AHRRADQPPRRRNQGRGADHRPRQRQARRPRHARRADRARWRLRRALPDAARERAPDRARGRLMAVAAKRPGLEAEAVLGKAYDVRLIRRLWRYVRPHRALLAAWVAFMNTTIVFELAQPFLLAYALEHHIKQPHRDMLAVDAAIFVGLVVAQNLSSF